MAKKQNIELHNEEVREIMKEIPGSIIRWGLTIIFLIFLSIIIGSYFFRFKEVVSAPLIITTSNPPAALISKTTGRIEHWFVADGSLLKKDEYIAVIKNLNELEDILQLEDFITKLTFDGTIAESIQIALPTFCQLGELQENYNSFCQNYTNYCLYLSNNFLPQKIELLLQQMQKQEQQYKLSLRQQKMLEEELNIARKTFERNQQLLDKGGVSENQIEEAKARLLQTERAYINFIASLKSSEINIINQKRSLLELNQQHSNENIQFKQEIENKIHELKTQIELWKGKYLLTSPVNGYVTFTKYWSENHVISAGDRLATIVPANSSSIICRATVASSGIGKVEVGQRVNIKLAGYPFMEHGMLTGTINTVSLVPEQEGYIIEIAMNEGMLSSYSEQLKLVQEMDGTAEIIADEMRMIYRFINPLKMLFDK